MDCDATRMESQGRGPCTGHEAQAVAGRSQVVDLILLRIR